MAGGPSPSSTSPSNLSNSPFLHSSLSSSSSSSPPKQLFSSQNTMTADVFSPSHAYAMPVPMGKRRDLDKNGLLSFSEAETSPEPKGAHTIFLRKLPTNSDKDAVRNMLLFAKDLMDCELVSAPPKSPDDMGFVSAVAHFRTLESAKEARDLLNGKRNATNDATMIVEMLHDNLPGTIGSRRNTVDSTAMRQGSVSALSGIAGATANGRQSSRYNGTFQTLEKMSPPNGTPGLGNGEFPVQNLFSATSPVNTSFPHRIANVGKNTINDEADDDEGLLKESIGYGTTPVQNAIPRRTTNPSAGMPITRGFASLSLNTNGANGMSPPPMPNYASPRSAATMQSPGTALSAMSPHSSISSAMGTLGPNANYQQFQQHYNRPTYPPVNPADQNPPCNTLYVGNLPVDTSEDELKALFSKQRGYKRLCFRTKQNGPMCFVEFEDVSFATKALNELYGHPLHNSVKGGIRLSFSKNPLGVRTGQATTMGPASAITPTTPLPGFGGGNVNGPPGFSTATGPPPGLSAPPGLSTPSHSNGSPAFGMYSNSGFGMSHNDMASPIRSQPMPAPLTANGHGNGFGGMGGNYSAYMMGR
ncbi:hypothetical protein PMIN06_004378 [Paraphaeosphaeria minitans]